MRPAIGFDHGPILFPATKPPWLGFSEWTTMISAFSRSRDWKQLQTYADRSFTRLTIGYDPVPIPLPDANPVNEVFGRDNWQRHIKAA